MKKKFKIFRHYKHDELEEKINKWIFDEKPDIIDFQTTFNTKEGYIYITIYYKEYFENKLC